MNDSGSDMSTVYLGTGDLSMSLNCSDSSSASIECDLDVSLAESDSDDNDWDGTRGIDNGSHTSRFTLVPNSLPSTVIR